MLPEQVANSPLKSLAIVRKVEAGVSPRLESHCTAQPRSRSQNFDGALGSHSFNARLADTSQGAGHLGDCLRGALVDRFPMAEDGALEREFRQLLHTLMRLGHVGGVLGIGTSELVADVV